MWLLVYRLVHSRDTSTHRGSKYLIFFRNVGKSRWLTVHHHADYVACRFIMNDATHAVKFAKVVEVSTCFRYEFLPPPPHSFLLLLLTPSLRLFIRKSPPRATHFRNGPYRARMGRRLEEKIYFVIMKITDLQRVRSTLPPFSGADRGNTSKRISWNAYFPSETTRNQVHDLYGARSCEKKNIDK